MNFKLFASFIWLLSTRYFIELPDSRMLCRQSTYHQDIRIPILHGCTRARTRRRRSVHVLGKSPLLWQQLAVLIVPPDSTAPGFLCACCDLKLRRIDGNLRCAVRFAQGFTFSAAERNQVPEPPEAGVFCSKRRLVRAS